MATLVLLPITTYEIYYKLGPNVDSYLYRDCNSLSLAMETIGNMQAAGKKEIRLVEVVRTQKQFVLQSEPQYSDKN